MKRRFHDLGAESGPSIAKEPERINYPKRTVLGIIQNRGNSEGKKEEQSEVEKIKVNKSSSGHLKMTLNISQNAEPKLELMSIN